MSRADNPFGVLAFLPWNHDWNYYKYSKSDLNNAVKLMKECGITFVRMDFLWNDIEPREGRYDFDKYDYIVSLLKSENIGILGVLGYSADWAGPSWNSLPYNNDTFLKYISLVINRYKGSIKHWEIWNEPDHEEYWDKQDGMVSYTALLKDVYTRAKIIDPNCKILNGGLTKNINVALKNICPLYKICLHCIIDIFICLY